MKKILVLGLGNELFGDDGVGIHVVRRMKSELDERPDKPPWCSNTDIKECTVSGLALLDEIEGYDDLIIVDTIKKIEPVPGWITVLEESDLRDIPGPSPHYVSIPQAFEIGKSSGLKVPSRVKIVAVEAKSLYELGEGLTEEMTEAIPEIIRRVEGLLSG